MPSRKWWIFRRDWRNFLCSVFMSVRDGQRLGVLDSVSVTVKCHLYTAMCADWATDSPAAVMKDRWRHYPPVDTCTKMWNGLSYHQLLRRKQQVSPKCQLCTRLHGIVTVTGYHILSVFYFHSPYVYPFYHILSFPLIYYSFVRKESRLVRAPCRLSVCDRVSSLFNFWRDEPIYAKLR
jgi:hypothetical protein